MNEYISGLPSLEGDLSTPIQTEINALCEIRNYTDQSFNTLSTLIYTEHSLSIGFKTPLNDKTNLVIPFGNRDFSFDKAVGVKLPKLSTYKELLLPKPLSMPKKLDLSNHGYENTEFTIMINPYELIKKGKSPADVGKLILNYILQVKRLVETNHVLNVFETTAIECNKAKSLDEISGIFKRANLINRDLKAVGDSNVNPEIDLTKAIAGKLKELMSADIDDFNVKKDAVPAVVLILIIGGLLLNGLIVFLAGLILKYIVIGIIKSIIIMGKIIYNIIVFIFGGNSVPLLGLYGDQAIDKLRKLTNDHIVDPLVAFSKSLNYYLTNEGKDNEHIVT